MRHLKADIAIIGGGAAGLSIAAGAAQMGARVVLFESGQMGGDCLNTGCVPSKTLLAEAAAREVEARLTPETAYRDAMQEVARVISAISPHDSIERFESLGVRVINQHARFDGMRHLVSADYSVRFKRAVIATGAEPAIPNIPGLEQVPYLTTDTLWSHGSHPRRLMIIGAGPVGIELALAHQKLGASVVLVEQVQLAPQLPAAAGDCIRSMLTEAGVRVLEGWEPERVNVHEGAVNVAFRSQPAIEVDTLLLASGRFPSTDGLNLESGGGAEHRRSD
jgi:Pyruvate/2-oxoglutarate dehydrogenase complex, dihydrolipoamide dehydrogenase (E3) component, and related enzymes